MQQSGQSRPFWLLSLPLYQHRLCPASDTSSEGKVPWNSPLHPCALKTRNIRIKQIKNAGGQLGSPTNHKTVDLSFMYPSLIYQSLQHNPQCVNNVTQIQTQINPVSSIVLSGSYTGSM